MDPTPLITPFVEQLRLMADQQWTDKNLTKMTLKFGHFLNVFPNSPMLKWDKNRPINRCKVQEIVKNIELRQMRGQSTLVHATIIIGTVNGLEPKILDGQHRFEAFAQIYNTDDRLLIDLIDYASEDERFADFLTINSNTPLPDIYRDITDRSSFNKSLTQRLRDHIKMAYVEHFTDVDALHDDPYAINEIGLLEHLYASICLYNVSFQDADKFLSEFIASLSCPLLFPVLPDQLNSYPQVARNILRCSKVKHDGCQYQCTYRMKDHGNYCGLHRRSTCKTADFDGKRLRESQYQAKKNAYFLLWFNYGWINRVQSKIRINTIFD